MGIASITRKQLLDLLRPGIDELFQEAYATFDPQLYITEVDFGHERTTQAVSNSEGSSADVSK